MLTRTATAWFCIDFGATQDASMDAAIAAASRSVRLHEAPALKARIEAAYQQALGSSAEDEARRRGIPEFS